jgi:hypothetical protein
MSWTPLYEDVDEITNSAGTLIMQARFECEKRLHQHIFKALRDQIGLVGFETEKYLLCAKKEPYGNIVSCHAGLLQKAIDTDKQLLMYIQKGSKFYAFIPEQCLAEGRTNLRGGIEMVNFQIKLGSNVEAYP